MRTMPPKLRVSAVKRVKRVVARPAVTVMRSVRQNVPKQKDLDRIVSDMFSSVTSIVNQPAIFVFVVIAVVLTVSSLTAESGQDLLSIWIKDLQDNVNLKKVGDFLAKHKLRTMGVLWFVPAWLSVPKAYRIAMLLAMSIWIALIPEAGVIEYMVQAIAIRMYFRVTNEMARMMIIASVAVMYWAGFIFQKSSVEQTIAGSSPSPGPGKSTGK